MEVKSASSTPIAMHAKRTSDLTNFHVRGRVGFAAARNSLYKSAYSTTSRHGVSKLKYF